MTKIRTLIFFDSLKKRITKLENGISKKDETIDHLTSQLFTSKVIYHNDKNDLQKNDDNDETNKNLCPG